MKNIVLLSYPRSGNTITRYILEFITNYYSKGYDNYHDASLINQANNNMPYILKNHGHNEQDNYFLNNLSPINNKLIFLFRHPYESYIRHNCLEREYCDINSCYNLVATAKDTNLLNIQKFDNFKGEKINVFYEQLITDHKKFIMLLSDFVKGNSSKTLEIIENYNFHSNKCRDIYQNRKTGETVTLNSATVSKKELIKFYRNKAGITPEQNLYFLKKYKKFLLDNSISEQTVSHIIDYYINQEKER